MTQAERESKQGELFLAVSKLRHYAAELYSERVWNVSKLQQSLDLLRDFEKVIGRESYVPTAAPSMIHGPSVNNTTRKEGQ